MPSVAESVPTVHPGAPPAGNGGAPELTADAAARLDGFVARARTAADAFRALDQAEVDRIVWAMVVAGLRNAVELAQLAMEETTTSRTSAPWE
jgi:acetaldehyde dehydrogenase/alcohol dehydrogenase